MISESSRGAAIKNINAKQLSNFELPLPLIDEQRRIVAKIKECMSRIDEIEKLRHDSMEMNSKLLDSALEKALSQLEGTETSLEEVCSIQLSSPIQSWKKILICYMGGANIESKTGRLIN